MSRCRNASPIITGWVEESAVQYSRLEMTAELTPYQEFDHTAGLLWRHVHVASLAEVTAASCYQVQLKALPNLGKILLQKLILVVPKVTFGAALSGGTSLPINLAFSDFTFSPSATPTFLRLSDQICKGKPTQDAAVILNDLFRECRELTGWNTDSHCMLGTYKSTLLSLPTPPVWDADQRLLGYDSISAS